MAEALHRQDADIGAPSKKYAKDRVLAAHDVTVIVTSDRKVIVRGLASDVEIVTPIAEHDFFHAVNEDAGASASLTLETLPEPGGKLPDGTVYVGRLKDHFYLATTPKDAPGAYTFHEAGEYVRNMTAFGHADWEVPNSKAGLTLYNARDEGELKGSFHAPCYRLSEESVGHALVQWFTDGYQGKSSSGPGLYLPIRPIRIFTL